MKTNEKLPQKPIVSFGKFENIDLRVAQVLSAPLAEGTRKPCRVITVDMGHLGTRTSVGQFALIPEEQLVGRKVVVCCNLAPREMGPYVSEVLVLGAPHPESPADQDQALPLFVDARAICGDKIF